MFRSLIPLVLIAAACAGPEPTVPGQDRTPVAPSPANAPDPITVMTQNLYPGANLDLVIGALASADPSDDVPSLQTAIATLEATDFRVRANAIADAIAAARPHAVGLQEVASIDLALDLGTPIILSVHFLPVLQAALDQRGLNYRVAAQEENFAVAPLPGISFADSDVLLVDADRVSVTTGSGHAFSNNLGVVAPGVDLERGWVGARVTIDGHPYYIASTHPESGHQPGLAELRAAQISELIGSLPGDVPTILLGDLNDEPGSPMYQVLGQAGFTDAWRALRPGASGDTCCHADDLSDPVAHFTQRIDYVFTRGLGTSKGRLIGDVKRVGAQPSDRIAGPEFAIWPSDHAGLIATVRSPAGVP
ncbi:MAG TPA: endonuclease/exonuclease/phosphatase family protein [Gemmatimonadales bacterium]|nr:endonuclease/exonuclease/phosphatase family protein [Gemmatimonadales bacterium]